MQQKSNKGYWHHIARRTGVHLLQVWWDQSIQCADLLSLVGSNDTDTRTEKEGWPRKCLYIHLRYHSFCYLYSGNKYVQWKCWDASSSFSQRCTPRLGAALGGSLVAFFWWCLCLGCLCHLLQYCMQERRMSMAVQSSQYKIVFRNWHY